MQKREARVARKTNETDIEAAICLDGRGTAQVDTGVPFFDHMLSAFARHGLFDLEVRAQGDLEVDAHHTVEDVGIVLGQAAAQALGDKRGITRMAHAAVPMDEALVLSALDLSGRGGGLRSGRDRRSVVRPQEKLQDPGLFRRPVQCDPAAAAQLLRPHHRPDPYQFGQPGVSGGHRPVGLKAAGRAVGTDHLRRRDSKGALSGGECLRLQAAAGFRGVPQ